jgi:A/G-specific adenine glycosylase
MLSFQESILTWYDKNKRDLPWRNTAFPYFIWISEVILQQTRVEQGLPFYHRFVERFPNVQSLAAADENEVLAVWKGLGYYSRARKLHHAAKLIVENGSSFPNSFKTLLELPGIGPYTAGAIASIAYNEAVPALDGNAFRIMTRVFNISEPVSSSKAQKVINSLAKEWISKSRPGDFNQALMDLGSSICVPRQPICPSCPLNEGCEAFSLGNFHDRPVKTPKKPQKNRFLLFEVHLSKKKMGLTKVSEGNIWKNLYLFPFREFTNEEDWLSEVKSLKKEGVEILERGVHILSHQKLHFFTQVSTSTPSDSSRMKWVSEEELQGVATPAIVAKILQQCKNQSSPYGLMLSLHHD